MFDFTKCTVETTGTTESSFVFSFFFLNCNISLFNLTSSDDQNVMLKGLNNSLDDFVLLEEKYARDKLSSLAILLERLRNEWSY